MSYCKLVTLKSIECNLNGACEELNDLKSKIDDIDTILWKKVRWYINKYDFKVDNKIINRAYYKYLEIANKFNIYDKSVNVLHLAEAPGGFIQVSLDKRRRGKKTREIDPDGFISWVKSDEKQVDIWTISLNCKNNKKVPSYHENILKSNVNIVYGYDDSGDLLDKRNIEYLEKYLPKMDIVTGDGGFDEGVDFNNKEQLHINLIKNEIDIGMCKLNIGGSLIVKMFDTFTVESYNLLEHVYLNFEQVWIYKPYTSRPTNSERYIVCKGYTPNIKDKCELNIDEINFDLYKLQSSALKFALLNCNKEMWEYINTHEDEIIKEKDLKFKEWLLDNNKIGKS